MQYVISFLEGIITFISPCLLPMIPIYISYFAGGGVRSTRKTLAGALGFVAGFTIVFVAMGALAGTVGSFLKVDWTHGVQPNYIVNGVRGPLNCKAAPMAPCTIRGPKLAEGKVTYGYQYNSGLASTSNEGVTKVQNIAKPSMLIVLADSWANNSTFSRWLPNQYDGTEDTMHFQNRHGKQANMLHADWHVSSMDARALNWQTVKDRFYLDPIHERK